jgi:regulator of cell morphogenesis and NO signaling
LHSPDLDSSLPDWVIECPPALRVFERIGLDYSCGGKSLEFVCRERGLDPTEVLNELLSLLPEHSDDSGRRRLPSN